ncbi:anti-sigma factor [Couchioplanes caeruleus]|uniref:anti-sigma factor n=1 Tax=Couchioplanes caeruleus TaxID=56438 RepID=UPI0020C0AB86|nr:anti-sigma factor [Couchioplanes caeruleus]UQU62961.1 anti-sigma factor [Couchioplanes caeruleus]
MQHLDPDRLVLLSLAEEAADEHESAHLAGCATCRDELRTLEHVAELGAESADMRDLPPPPESVWAGIQAEVARATAPTALPRRRLRRIPSGDRRRWLAPVLAAAAAAVIGIAGTAVVMRGLDRPPAADVTARATLAPLPSAPPDARGDVRVLSDDEVVVDVQNLPLTTGFHEVWLIDPDDTTKMLSLGNLPARPEAVLPVPPGTDLNRYRLVDVSDEAHDGDAAHSGKSLLRGTLTY